MVGTLELHEIRSDKVDGLSDIFLLGVIVYEMFAGYCLFLVESLATISNRILSQMMVLASDLNPLMSLAFDDVYMQQKTLDSEPAFL